MQTPLLILWALTSFIAVIRLLLDRRDPTATLAWILAVCSIPFLGPFFLFVFGSQRLMRIAHKRKEEIGRMIAHPSFLAHLMGREKLSTGEILPINVSQVLELTRQVSDYEATRGNSLDFLIDPSQALAEMQAEIAQAKSFVHLEYYILSSDEVTKQLFENLIEAAKRGVEVRILYDAFGSLSLKKLHFRNLKQYGIKTAGFLPFSVAPQRLNFNFRNHRKLLIIDGKVAFTGGANIGREYLGKAYRNQWRDYFVRVTGPAVLQLQDVFGKDWQFTTQEDLFHARYYPKPEIQGGTVIQVLESGPDSPFKTLHQAVFLMLNSADEEILMVTPYFVPDFAVLTSLIVAALSGVKVKILLPSKNDSKLVQQASRSFYEDLLDAGVEIYEYTPKILHAKLLTIDKQWAILGSANMDIRSFRLNFELNLLVYGTDFNSRARDFFNDELKHSTQILLEEFKRRPVTARLLENACRLLSPML